MSDFDPVGYGELRAQVAALEKDVAELRGDDIMGTDCSRVGL